MSDWRDPIRTALANRTGPCNVFFRDDDAGWNDARLLALLDRFAAHGMPIDLAAIPAALSRPLVRQLIGRIQRGDRLGIHQHGYVHANHERVGRKCEFGPGRSLMAQHLDLRAGRTMLDDAFGPLVDPIFTPPWNRCTADTVACLAELGFRALSRDVGATPLPGARLAQLPVAVDWCKLHPPGSDPQALAERIAFHVASAPVVGIMLHHAVMDDVDLTRVSALLATLRAQPRVRRVAMRALLPESDGDDMCDSPTADTAAPALVSARTY